MNIDISPTLLELARHTDHGRAVAGAVADRQAQSRCLADLLCQRVCGGGGGGEASDVVAVFWGSGD